MPALCKSGTRRCAVYVLTFSLRFEIPFFRPHFVNFILLLTLLCSFIHFNAVLELCKPMEALRHRTNGAVAHSALDFSRIRRIPYSLYFYVDFLFQKPENGVHEHASTGGGDSPRLILALSQTVPYSTPLSFHIKLR